VQLVDTMAADQLRLTEPLETAAVSPVGAAGTVVHEAVDEGGEVVPVDPVDPVDPVEVVPVGSVELEVEVFPDESDPPHPAISNATPANPRLTTPARAALTRAAGNKTPQETGLRLCMAARHPPCIEFECIRAQQPPARAKSSPVDRT
jgi:hypothetical protein